jgi:hypothetical protein
MATSTVGARGIITLSDLTVHRSTSRHAHYGPGRLGRTRRPRRGAPRCQRAPYSRVIRFWEPEESVVMRSSADGINLASA